MIFGVDMFYLTYDRSFLGAARPHSSPPVAANHTFTVRILWRGIRCFRMDEHRSNANGAPTGAARGQPRVKPWVGEPLSWGWRSPDGATLIPGESLIQFNTVSPSSLPKLILEGYPPMMFRLVLDTERTWGRFDSLTENTP